jgi:tRNA-(ms[2]io[6]A)-hydroxylase
MRLQVATDPAWLEAVLQSFDAFLLDHAACEGKAAASAAKLAASYPQHTALVDAMRELEREEKEHYAEVRALADARGLGPTPYYRDAYVSALLATVNSSPARVPRANPIHAEPVDAPVRQKSAKGGATAGIRFSNPRLLDRLLVAGIIEARACERLGLVAGALAPGPLRDLYMDFTRSEARHHGLFVRLAKVYHIHSDVDARLEVLLPREAEIVRALPIRPAIH